MLENKMLWWFIGEKCHSYLARTYPTYGDDKLKCSIFSNAFYDILNYLMSDDRVGNEETFVEFLRWSKQTTYVIRDVKNTPDTLSHFYTETVRRRPKKPLGTFVTLLNRSNKRFCFFWLMPSPWENIPNIKGVFNDSSEKKYNLLHFWISGF